MLTATQSQPQPSNASPETFRSLHRHYWATQCLTLRLHLNSSWNCLPSKLKKIETQNCKRDGQYFTRFGFLWEEIEGFSSQPVEYYYTADNTGVIEEENRLSKLKI